MHYRQTARFILLLISLTFVQKAYSDNLLNRPQKIAIDFKRNELLISNEGNGGMLVKVDSAGNQSYFKYLDSLDNEKHTGFIDGIEVLGDTIYGVAAGRKIYGYDLVTRKQVMNAKLPGSSTYYLSSVIADSAGHLYISCPLKHEIYKFRISDRTYQVFADAADTLRYPNGMLLEKEKNRIVVIGDAPSNARIFSISLTDSTVKKLKQTTLSSPDGIVKDKYGTYYIGGYSLPGLMKIDSAFTQNPSLFYQGPYLNMIYPTYDYRDNSILITCYENKAFERIYIDTGIEPEENKQSQNLLGRNYPNPFNNTTTISYVVPEGKEPVSLTLYNAKGELAARLLNKQVQAGGFYTVRINANGLASGLYTCIYTIGSNKQEMQKLVLLK